MPTSARPSLKSAPGALRVLTVPEMASRLGVSRFTLYARIRSGKLLPFKALYQSGPIRFLVTASGAPRPLPYFTQREPEKVAWVAPSKVARTLRVSTRLVQSACAASILEARRSPGARARVRYVVAVDKQTGLPMPAGKLALPRGHGGESTKRH